MLSENVIGRYSSLNHWTHRRSAVAFELLLLSLASNLQGCKRTEAPAPPAQETAVDALANEAAPVRKEPLNVEETVFDFSALAHTGQRFKLSDFLDQPSVVYFCHEDETDLCRGVAFSLRDDWLLLNPSLSMAFGVSPEDTFVHREFAYEHKLPHLLIADTQSSVHQVFGIQPGMSVAYLIGTDRKVLQRFSPLSGSFARDVAGVLRQLGLEKPAPPP